MLDYGYNFMNTKIFIDNESTICIVKNPVFHSKTKHIEIRHHFIRDSNEKKLIQMIKIHTDQNVADLLIKAFNVGRFQYLIASIGMLNLSISIVGLTYYDLEASVEPYQVHGDQPAVPWPVLVRWYYRLAGHEGLLLEYFVSGQRGNRLVIQGEVVIVCHEKVVRISLEGDEILQVQGSANSWVYNGRPERISHDQSMKFRNHPANVVVDALSRKERVKPRRVQAMAMTIQYGVRGMKLAAQSEAFKQENVLAERLHGLD
ncbi:hypothetical protein Tco_0614986 [Tanacetum coccineum]